MFTLDGESAVFRRSIGGHQMLNIDRAGTGSTNEAVSSSLYYPPNLEFPVQILTMRLLHFIAHLN
jgi:hypothetical protein